MIKKPIKPIHYLRSDNYYLCIKGIKACGNGVCGLATKNYKLVTCKNCMRKLGAGNEAYRTEQDG